MRQQIKALLDNRAQVLSMLTLTVMHPVKSESRILPFSVPVQYKSPIGLVQAFKIGLSPSSVETVVFGAQAFDALRLPVRVGLLITAAYTATIAATSPVAML